MAHNWEENGVFPLLPFKKLEDKYAVYKPEHIGMKY